MSDLHIIRDRILAAERKAGRTPGSVTLIAVSKLQPPERVETVLAQGQQVFGENYVQEAAGKWPAWKAQYPGVALHLIGPLQGNKARQAVGLFDAIHTLDRESLASRIARLVDETGRQPELFVQVNTGAEPQKGGIHPGEADRFIDKCRSMGLSLAGAMCIPPDGHDPIPHFCALREIAERNDLPGLSMGMSADYEAAIAQGATHIRVGSAIFGARAARASGA